MIGFGIDPKDPNKIGDEDDPRIVGHDVTNGNEEGGRTAMENLLQKDPDINVIHTINEPAAVGAYEALKAVGKEKDVGTQIAAQIFNSPRSLAITAGVIGALGVIPGMPNLVFLLLASALGYAAWKIYEQHQRNQQQAQAPAANPWPAPAPAQPAQWPS